MTPFYQGMIAGIFIGVFCGIFIAALLQASRTNFDEIERRDFKWEEK